jgi:uncharacterized protein YciI
MYFIFCTVDPVRSHLRTVLRRDHLAHLIRERDTLVFGGVVETDARPFQRVCYFVNLDSQTEARAFVSRDPYSVMYRDIEIMDFRQRIPEATDGLLEDLYRQLAEPSV